MKATACVPKAMLFMNTQVLCRSCPMLARSTWGAYRAPRLRVHRGRSEFYIHVVSW